VGLVFAGTASQGFEQAVQTYQCVLRSPATISGALQQLLKSFSVVAMPS